MISWLFVCILPKNTKYSKVSRLYCLDYSCGGHTHSIDSSYVLSVKHAWRTISITHSWMMKLDEPRHISSKLSLKRAYTKSLNQTLPWSEHDVLHFVDALRWALPPMSLYHSSSNSTSNWTRTGGHIQSIQVDRYIFCMNSHVHLTHKWPYKSPYQIHISKWWCVTISKGN